MPNCTHCHQPQTAALVICPECYRALTERTVNMDDKKLIEALERCAQDKCEECAYSKFPSRECMNRLMKDAASQLAEKDKQLAALIAALIDCGYDDGSICNYCANDGACDIETNEYVQKKGSCFVFRGPQKAGEGGG